MIRLQRTLKHPIAIEGIALHTGRHVRMFLRPAPVDSGVSFFRTDLNGAEIKAIAANTVATSFATTLSQNGASVQTVEHLLAAFAGLGVDNVVVEIDGDEVPVLDGSAGPFARLIAHAGVENQEKVRPMIKVVRPIIVREGNKQLAIWPSETSSISFFIDFNHPMLREQSFNYTASEEGFLREIADARTFGFLSDVQALQANGLAKGASLDNAVALGEVSVLNKDGLRFTDEFVRHKILDLIGDLSLAGMPVIGHVVAHKSGHGLNTRMAAKLIEDPRNWILVGSSAETEWSAENTYQYHMAL